MDQPPIADHALIGDTRSAALCSRDGSITWWCLPGFDGEPVFSSLLEPSGGVFSISIEGARPDTRRYREGSAVLETSWASPGGRVLVTDGMVVDASSGLRPPSLLVRRVETDLGRARVRVLFAPGRGMPALSPRVLSRTEATVVTFEDLAMALRTSPPMPVTPGVVSVVEMAPMQTLTFALSAAHREPLVVVEPEHAWSLLQEADAWWREWSADVSYDGPAREAVVRSLITLRLLTYSPSGAPVASPTTSLPERIGGDRNWDYRFAWPRDASIGVAAFLAAGKREEAASFMRWILHATRRTRPQISVLYTVFGGPGPPERDLPDVRGYRDSRPVRVGNAAQTQRQLDVYGWVLDAAWAMHREGIRFDGETRRALWSFADFAARRWHLPDAGIWERRGAPEHYVHSKLMTWTALDRAVRMADRQPVRPSRLSRWRRACDEVAARIRRDGFDRARGTYVRSFESGDLDAALLLLPVLEFDAPGSPRVRGTIEAVRRDLAAGGPLLYRHRPETREREGAFLACSFWLAQALACTGAVDEATQLFEDLCERANDVGLYGEEMDPVTGEHLGNFPQALTHAALVQAARTLEDVLHGRRRMPSIAP